MALTQQQKQDYQDNGFLILRKAIPDTELDRLDAGLMRALRSGNCLGGDQTYPAPATRFTVEGQTQDDPDLLFIAEHPAIVGPVEELLGGPACLSAFVSYLKTPGATGTGGDYRSVNSTGHCDYKTYQQAGSSLNWLFAILPLVDLDEETGPLLLAPGSHRSSRIVPVNDRISRVERAPAKEVTPLEDARLRRGDLCLMHMFTWHEGKANQSDHDRYGIYNKYRAVDAPPASGPQLFQEGALRGLTAGGARLLPHVSDLPFEEARLIVDRDGKILLAQDGNGGWQLPGTREVDPAGGVSVTGKLIDQLEAGLAANHGFAVPWMSYVSDHCGETGVRRYYAYTDDDGTIAGSTAGNGFSWTAAAALQALAANGALSRADAGAVRTWSEESWCRGIGESSERAKSQ